MEMLQLFDKGGRPLSKSIARGCKDLAENEYIKLATIWLKKQGISTLIKDGKFRTTSAEQFEKFILNN